MITILQSKKNIAVSLFYSFRPIDHERNDSGAASPSEMFRIRKH